MGTFRPTIAGLNVISMVCPKVQISRFLCSDLHIELNNYVLNKLLRHI